MLWCRPEVNNPMEPLPAELQQLGMLLDTAVPALIGHMNRTQSWSAVAGSLSATERAWFPDTASLDDLARDMRHNLALLQLLCGQRIWLQFLQDELGSLPEQSMVWCWEAWLARTPIIRFHRIAEVVILFGSATAASVAVECFTTKLVDCHLTEPSLYAPNVLGATIERVIIDAGVLRESTVWLNLLMHDEMPNCRYFVRRACDALTNRGDTRRATFLREYDTHLLDVHCACSQPA